MRAYKTQSASRRIIPRPLALVALVIATAMVLGGCNRWSPSRASPAVTRGSAGTAEADAKLVTAAEAGDIASVEAILSAGADPDALGPDKVPLISLTANSPDLTAVLLEHGADPMARDDQGRTPLHWAAIAGSADSARLLLECGARPQVRSGASGETPLHVAAYHDSVAVAEILLEHGVDAGAPDASGATPLHWAAQSQQGRVVPVLLEWGAELDAQQDHTGHTPLHWACRTGPANTVQALLDAGAKVDLPAVDGRTPLHVAAQEGRGERLLSLLAAASADLNARAAHRTTPLMLAAMADHGETVSALLQLGADPGLRDDADRDPLELAREMGAQDAARRLKEASEEVLGSSGDGLPGGQCGSRQLALRFIWETATASNAKGHLVYPTGGSCRD